MIKLTMSTTIEKIYDFIDNRLVLLLSEKKLKQATTIKASQYLVKDKYKVKNIDDSILYVVRNSDKASMFISTIVKTSSTKIKNEIYGATFRKKSSDQMEMYIDTLRESFEKGIINNDVKKFIIGKKLGILLVILLLLAGIVVTGGIGFFLVVIFVIISYPVQYLFNKRKFKQSQEKMGLIASIFESEFNVTQKVDTKDWINFWGKVKSDIKEEILSTTPIQR